MVQLVATEREPRRAVRHDTLALRCTDGGAEIGFAREARRALPAFGRVKWDDVVALLHGCHARPDIDDDAGALMAQDGRKQAFRVGAGEREFIGVAYSRGLHLDQHLTGFRSIKVNVYDLKRLTLVKGNSGTSFHRNSRWSVVGELT